MSGTGASPVHYLWLLPEAADTLRLARLIETLTTSIGAAPFEPHLTLLGKLRGNASGLTDSARRLAESVAPFTIIVAGVGHGAEFFRCVYLTAAGNETLTTLRAEAERAFGPAEGDTPYTPHLSLVYGAPPVALRRRLADAAGIDPPTQFRVDRLRLVAGAPDYRNWRTVQTFALNGAHPTDRNG